MRRHTLRLLLRQQGRCDVTFAHCCCGSRDVEASFWQTAVAAAGIAPAPAAIAAPRLLHRFEGGARSRLRFAEATWFSHMPWWSAKPPLFQRGGRLRRVIALHIGVDWITRLCQPSVSGAIVLRGGARTGCCRAARSGRQAAWRLGLSSWNRASSCSDGSDYAPVLEPIASSSCSDFSSMCVQSGVDHQRWYPRPWQRGARVSAWGSIRGVGAIELVSSGWWHHVGRC